MLPSSNTSTLFSGRPRSVSVCVAVVCVFLFRHSWVLCLKFVTQCAVHVSDWPEGAECEST